MEIRINPYDNILYINGDSRLLFKRRRYKMDGYITDWDLYAEDKLFPAIKIEQVLEILRHWRTNSV